MKKELKDVELTSVVGGASNGVCPDTYYLGEYVFLPRGSEIYLPGGESYYIDQDITGEIADPNTTIEGWYFKVKVDAYNIVDGKSTLTVYHYDGGPDKIAKKEISVAEPIKVYYKYIVRDHM